MTNNDTVFNFEKLSVYKKSLDFIQSVYKITSFFPENEKFGLTSQFRRAAQSIALNIAEGAGESEQQFIRYLNISRGSIRECIVCSSISKNLDYINAKTDEEIRLMLTEISKMISGLKKTLDKTSSDLS